MEGRIASTPLLALPAACCCCLGEADSTFTVSGKTHKESGSVMVTRWSLPVCASCGQRLSQTGLRRSLSVVAICVTVVAAVWIAASFGWWPDVAVVGTGVAGAFMIWRGTLAAPAIIGWTVLDEAADCAWINSHIGLVRVCQIPRFENREYERQFRELNGLDFGYAVRLEPGRRDAEAHELTLR